MIYFVKTFINQTSNLLKLIGVNINTVPVLDLSTQQSSNIIAYGMTGSGSTCFGIFKNLNEISIFLESFNKHFNSKYFIWYGKKRDYNMNRIRSSKTLENIISFYLHEVNFNNQTIQ